MIFRISFRNVIRNRRRSLISFSALFFGVFLSLVLKGLTDGFSTMVTLSAIESRTASLQIRKKGSFENLSGDPTQFSFRTDKGLMEKIKALPDVRGVAGRMHFLGQLTNGRQQTLVYGTGIDPLYEPAVCARTGTQLDPGGAPLSPLNSSGIVLGRFLAESLDRRLNDSVVLSVVNPSGSHNSLDFSVQALARSASHLEDKRYVLMSLKNSQSLLNLQDHVTEIAIGLHDFRKLEKVKSQLQSLVSAEFEVLTWEQLQPFVRDILFRQKIGISVLAVSLLVMVVFLITNTMLMAVFERTKEMGTMMSLGVTRKQILSIFLLESTMLGVVAATAASFAGQATVYVLSINGFEFGTVAFETQLLKPELSAPFLAVTWLGAVACAALAGTYPALMASRLNPVEALRS